MSQSLDNFDLPDDPLGKRWAAAIHALLSCSSQAKAAKAAGVSRITIRRYLEIPAFVEAYRAARRAAFEVMIANLERTASKAVRTLEKNLKAERESDQIRAALGLLGSAIKAKEMFDLEQRMADIEKKLGAGSGAQSGEN